MYRQHYLLVYILAIKLPSPSSSVQQASSTLSADPMPESGVRYSKHLDAFTNAEICAQILDKSVFIPARSRLNCLHYCASTYQLDCTGINYYPDAKSCLLLRNGAFNNYTSGLPCRGHYRSDCPANFYNSFRNRKCYSLRIGKWNWNDSQRTCNGMHPASHAVIISDADEKAYVNRFLYSILSPSSTCAVFLGSSTTPTYDVWSAGAMTYLNSVAQPFAWYPYPGVKISFGGYSCWNSGEPNGYFDGLTLYCVEIYFDTCCNDTPCSLAKCVLCEVDQ
ncbi:hypothetical protein HELRODRAFT_180819 [Helobdella robusta]|uniref:C-type lectin domain-containing protein n=1 Tax=Helobdella robusta TaxID=6412 RepID=T1FGB6_HELRO|nr:hypothetical protein HELRODRAFT_180819 [Helobdella robusta]ESN93502.1 hypothetical protein HELRODRAFT_180819 [Helobdella robusta]